MTAEPAGPRDAVVANAAGRSWVELWPVVMRARGALLAEAVGVLEEQASWRAPAGQREDAWNVLQVLQHVITYTRNVAQIIEATARGETVVKDPPGAIHDVTEGHRAALLAAAVDASADLALLYRRLPAEPDLETTVSHPAFGPFNCREWFFFLTVHDEAHRRQIASLKQGR